MGLWEKLVIMSRGSIAASAECRVFAISTRASAAGIARIGGTAALWAISSWRASRNGKGVAIFGGGCSSSSSIIAWRAAFEGICRLFLSVTSFLSLGPRNPAVLQGCLCLEFGLKVKKIISNFSVLGVSTIGLSDSTALLFESVVAET